MLDFVFQNTGKILFGENHLNQLALEINNYGHRVLLVYGGGSIKKSGLYDEVVKLLNDNDIFFTELAGVTANPRISKVREGVKLCRDNDLDFILAVGGGSVIDCAKAIAGGFYYENDPWDFFIHKAWVTKALPIGAILTIAATGTEMNLNAVISNEESLEKKGTGSPFLIPKFSVLNPAYTYTVSSYQTAAGVADIMSHIFEQYFSPTPNTFLQDRISEAILKTCINYAPIAIKEPNNYEARANIMWASTLALNGLLSTGKLTDWATHMIEHEVSAMYDTTHGAGLAVLTPHWMEYVLNDKTVGKLKTYARNIWHIMGDDGYEIAREGIKKTAEFFEKLGLPTQLREIGVKEDTLATIAKNATLDGPLGRFKELKENDILAILKNAY